MPDSLFVFAVLALLLTPGPTNTLLTVGAAFRGLRASLPLLLGELAGYLVVVTPLAVAATAFLEDRPAFAIGLRIAAACWVLLLALRLWHHADRGQGGLRPVTIGQVFMTTVLNPKAAISFTTKDTDTSKWPAAARLEWPASTNPATRSRKSRE